MAIDNHHHHHHHHHHHQYISRALNPSVSNLPEAQSAVHVQLKLSKLHIQLKPSKQRNQRRQENKKQKPGMGGYSKQRPRRKSQAFVQNVYNEDRKSITVTTSIVFLVVSSSLHLLSLHRTYPYIRRTIGEPATKCRKFH